MMFYFEAFPQIHLDISLQVSFDIFPMKPNNDLANLVDIGWQASSKS